MRTAKRIYQHCLKIRVARAGGSHLEPFSPLVDPGVHLRVLRATDRGGKSPKFPVVGPPGQFNIRVVRPRWQEFKSHSIQDGAPDRHRLREGIWESLDATNTSFKSKLISRNCKRTFPRLVESTSTRLFAVAKPEVRDCYGERRAPHAHPCRSRISGKRDRFDLLRLKSWTPMWPSVDLKYARDASSCDRGLTYHAPARWLAA